MSKKILLVDDSETVLLMEKMILGSSDFDLVTARDGAEAVQVAEREKPDLVLLDVLMPRMDGLETCRRLRSCEATQATPIIMVTTQGEMEAVEAAYELGCSDYVTKPIDTLELRTKVENCLAS